MQIRSAKDLVVYQKAFELAMNLFQVSRLFPPEEKYALTDQVRRASRSVCSNLAEAWAKRRYPAHFISKLSDADGENSEVETWLDFAQKCGYLDSRTCNELAKQCREVGKMLGAMLRRPSPFLLISDL